MGGDEFIDRVEAIREYWPEPREDTFNMPPDLGLELFFLGQDISCRYLCQYDDVRRPPAVEPKALVIVKMRLKAQAETEFGSRIDQCPGRRMRPQILHCRQIVALIVVLLDAFENRQAIHADNGGHCQDNYWTGSGP